MLRASWLPVIFIINATILIAHQIDAAFWHEWELFHLPGGNQLNLILNLPVLALVLVAHREVARGSRRARAAHQFLAFLGYLTVSLHSVFFALGHPQFIQPTSLALLMGTGLLSTLQLICLLSYRDAAQQQVAEGRPRLRRVRP